MNGICAITGKDELGSAFNFRNRLHSFIKLILMIEKEGQLPILNVVWRIKQTKLDMDIYRRPMDIKRVVPFTLEHAHKCPRKARPNAFLMSSN